MLNPKGNPFENGDTAQGGSTEGGKDKNDKGKLTALQKSALMVWSRKMHEYKLPPVWADLESTTSVADMHRYLVHHGLPRTSTLANARSIFWKTKH